MTNRNSSLDMPQDQASQTSRAGGRRKPHDKVRSIEELARIVAREKSKGRSVVHAHGAFDLLHLGHVRHLEAARHHGDVIIVTLTADKFVNKGPGRPVFNENLRAEMLAALECVDWISINHHSDAVSAISAIQPDIYIKGHDYKNPEGDVTGKITSEQEAIEACGGRIEFTEEITFSSSELINSYLNVFDPHVREHLRSLRDDGGLDHLLELIERVRDYRLLFVGDAIIDQYQYVLPMGKAPKENMIATRYQEQEVFAGGVFAAANHLSSFCKEIDIVTVLGGRDSHKDMIEKSLKSNVSMTCLERDWATTTRKCRFIDPSYMRKLFEVYFMDDEPLVHEMEKELNALIAERAGDYDLVVVTDFGHGLIGPSTVDTLVSSSKFMAVNTQSNSANLGYNLITRYPRADYVCIDAPEARMAVGDRVSIISDILSNELPKKIACNKMIITHGKYGCVTYEKGEPTHVIPALADKVVDTVGAGDAFLAITAPLVRAGGKVNHIGFIGNVVGALMVQIVGHRSSIEKPSLVKALTALLK